MELLAPAGGMEQLKTALRFGADAVYGGMKGFGLRAFAGNFEEEALGEAVRLTRSFGKRFYVTLNLLPLDRDLEGLLAAARQACAAGVDAALVSDIGAALMLREALPEYDGTWAQNYDSPFLMYPLRHPHGASVSGLMTLSAMTVDSARRVELPIENSLMKLVDLDRFRFLKLFKRLH